MTAEPDHYTDQMAQAGAKARAAASILACADAATRDFALRQAADCLRKSEQKILEANALDMQNFSGSPAFGDRLLLNPARVEAMASGLEEVAALPDPLARTLAQWTRPNGLTISRIVQPLGVLGMIYESRPNVGADAAAIAIKSGNAILLRGGSESFHSAQAIHAAITAGLAQAGLPEDCVQVAPSTDRGFVAAMLAAADKTGVRPRPQTIATRLGYSSDI